MPNKRAALKQLRQGQTRHLRNLRITSELKTLDKKFQALLSAKQLPDAQAALKLLLKKIDTAKSKGIFHRNNAARQKSNLTRRLAALKK